MSATRIQIRQKNPARWLPSTWQRLLWITSLALLVSSVFLYAVDIPPLRLNETLIRMPSIGQCVGFIGLLCLPARAIVWALRHQPESNFQKVRPFRAVAMLLFRMTNTFATILATLLALAAAISWATSGVRSTSIATVHPASSNGCQVIMMREAIFWTNVRGTVYLSTREYGFLHTTGATWRIKHDLLAAPFSLPPDDDLWTVTWEGNTAVLQHTGGLRSFTQIEYNPAPLVCPS